MDGTTAAASAIGFASTVGRVGMPTPSWRRQGGILQLVCKTKKSIARQREQVDKILEIFKNEGESSLQHVHKELVHVPEVPWNELPKELDPHWVTFRGVKLESGLNWTRKKMMETLNPRSIRKRAQVESFYAALSLLKPEKGSTVVDFGSGSGNLVLPLAHLMPDLNFVAVDLKTEAIQILQNRSEAAGLKNCRAFNGYIEDFEESFDFALGLHVCGPASNAVMDSAVRSDAAFLLSPCCIGKLRTGAQPSVSLGPPGQGQQQREYPMSRWMGRRLNSETFELVAQAADRSEVRTDVFLCSIYLFRAQKADVVTFLHRMCLGHNNKLGERTSFISLGFLTRQCRVQRCRPWMPMSLRSSPTTWSRLLRGVLFARLLWNSTG